MSGVSDKYQALYRARFPERFAVTLPASVSIPVSVGGGGLVLPDYPKIGEPEPEPEPPPKPVSVSRYIPTSRPSRAEINYNAVTAEDRRRMYAADGSVIPIVYGRDTVGPLVFFIGESGSDFVIGMAWCLGEIDAVESITVAGEDVPDGVTFTHYTGTTSQGIDATILAIESSYADTLIATMDDASIGIAYTVAVYPQTLGLLRFEAVIRGMKNIYDPRLSGGAGGYVYTSNPSLVLADFIGSEIYGAGHDVLITSPSEQVSNWDFADWTSDDPDDWVVAGEDGVNYVTEDANGLRFYATVSAAYLNIKSTPPVEIGVTYKATLIIHSVTAGKIRLDYSDTGYESNKISNIDAPGTYTVIVTPTGGTDVRWYIVRDTTTIDLVIESFSLKAISSLADCADANDVVMADTQARRTIGLALTRNSDTSKWIETLRAYAGVILSDQNGEVSLIPDRPASTTRTLGVSDVIEGTLNISKDGLRAIPTVVTVRYTERGVTPWRDMTATAKAAGVDAGTTPRRESIISLPGIDNYQQAYREAVERLNYFTLSDLRVTWDTFDEGLQDQAGDVIEMTHPIGLTAKKMRLLSVDALSAGRWRVHAEEYDESVYSDTIEDTPSTPDTSLSDPWSPPALTGLVLVEEVYQRESGAFSSRIKATWDAAVYAYLRNYQIQILDGTDILLDMTTNEVVARSGPLKEATYYQGRIRGISSIGITGVWLTAYITAQGRQLAPEWPSGAELAGFEVGGEVRLSWASAVDIDLWRYEVRYGAVAVAWASATLLDRVDSLRLVTKDVSAGTYDFLVRALDSVGNYTETSLRREITVTLDSAAFLIDSHDFDMIVGSGETGSTTKTNVHEFARGRTDDRVRFVTDMGDTAVSRFTSTPLNTNYPNIAATYHSSGTSVAETETWDAGAIYAASWRSVIDADAVGSGDTVTPEMRLSENGSTWNDYTSLSEKTTARYAKHRVEALTTNTMLVSIPESSIKIDVVPREEHGSDTSSSSTYKRITLDQDYAFVKSIQLTPDGTAALMATVDNIQTGDPTTFDAYIFNNSGTQVAAGFQWTFKGV